MIGVRDPEINNKLKSCFLRKKNIYHPHILHYSMSRRAATLSNIVRSNCLNDM